MKGAIFKLLEDFVVTHHGPDAFDDLLDETEMQTTTPMVGPGTYPAEDLLALVGTAVEKYDVPVDDLLRAFGRHSFPGLANSVTELMVGMDDPHSFLLQLESVIHTEVRKLDSEADPARFDATEVNESEILLHYQSPFGLFPLVEGFLDGISDWYDMPLSYQLESTEGTNATFRIQTGPNADGDRAGAGQATDGATV